MIPYYILQSKKKKSVDKDKKISLEGRGSGDGDAAAAAVVIGTGGDDTPPGAKESNGKSDKKADRAGEEKKSDETLMDLLAKMSEAYMKTKQQNNELTHR